MAIVAVGHRGTALGVPENSIVSHNKAYEMGARGIEFDIQISADDEFVIFHDSIVDIKTDGTGTVKDMTVKQLKALHLVHEGMPTAEHMPTLKEGLENVRGRFMVDLDFKNGPDNSAVILRQALRDSGFDKDGSPLVTIFCRDRDDYNKVKSLNDICAIRPLYLGKDHAADMAEEGVGVVGLRNYQFTIKRAGRVQNLNMYVFTNTMRYNLWGLIRGGLGFSVKRNKPKMKTLQKIFKRAMDGGSLFIQTDYLPDLVSLLKEHDLYLDHVLDRNFQPILPVSSSEV